MMFLKYFNLKFNFRNKKFIDFRENFFHVFDDNDYYIDNQIIIDEIMIFFENFIPYFEILRF